MAKSQQQGISATSVWMIVFAFFWLVSTVWLVILYTGQEELRTENNRLRTSKSRLITSQEENAVEQVKSVVDGGPTVVGLLEAARAETARLATGEPKDGVAVVKTKRDELLSSIKQDRLVEKPTSLEDASLLSGMSRIYDLFKSENALRKAAQDRVVELEEEVARLTKLNADQQSDFEERSASLTSQLTESEAARAAYRTDRDEAVTQLERDCEQQRTQSDRELTQERQLRASLQQQLAAMKRRRAVEAEKYGEVGLGPRELATARKPDGKILTAIPGDNIVYIDLGTNDRITLGMPFAVYSSGKGIPADGRAKAQIEVVALAPSSAECRVLKNFGQGAILEGDLIASPLYDRMYPPSFLVIGDFDIGRDGNSDADGAKVIESLITNWGGKLTEELGALTDFVVLGAAPPKPRTLRNPTPEQVERQKAMQDSFDRYNDTIDHARSLSVPMLTQEVFLNFVGEGSTRRRAAN